jgi:hypothetical protein
MRGGLIDAMASVSLLCLAMLNALYAVNYELSTGARLTSTDTLGRNIDDIQAYIETHSYVDPQSGSIYPLVIPGAVKQEEEWRPTARQPQQPALPVPMLTNGTVVNGWVGRA